MKGMARLLAVAVIVGAGIFPLDGPRRRWAAIAGWVIVIAVMFLPLKRSLVSPRIDHACEVVIGAFAVVRIGFNLAVAFAFERVTEGITRTVYLFGRYAVKVPSFRGKGGVSRRWTIFLAGLQANMQEREWSKANYAGLLPVLLADPLGFVLVMPRVEPLDDELSDEEFEKFCDRGDYHIPTENKPGHFAMWNGEMVALDYGS